MFKNWFYWHSGSCNQWNSAPVVITRCMTTMEPMQHYLLLIHLTAMCCQISGITRGQRQIMHQMDNLNNLLRGGLGGERSQQTRINNKSIVTDLNYIGASIVVVVAVGCLGIFLTRKWFIYMQKIVEEFIDSYKRQKMEAVF